MGDLSPMTAAEIAKSLGVRVYTIDVTNKVAPYPVPVAGGVQYLNIPVEIDTKTLKEIAQTTDGNFYRATNNAELKQIYRGHRQVGEDEDERDSFRQALRGLPIDLCWLPWLSC